MFIGNGGAEFGVRGYVTAYDAESGEEVWRFFTVPGDPSLPFEHPEMELAAETWKGGSWWNSAVAAPCGTPSSTTLTSTLSTSASSLAALDTCHSLPGGGDNLFLSSIVALDADTGSMKWYYQTTPGDNWDYTAVQDIALADMEVDGEMRKFCCRRQKTVSSTSWIGPMASCCGPILTPQ